MVRPHRFVLTNVAGNGVNHFSGIVEHIVYRGEIVTLTARSGAAVLKADLPTHAGKLPEKGSRVTLAVAPEDVTVIGDDSQ